MADSSKLRLSTRDKNLIKKFAMSPEETMLDMMDNQSPANLKLLDDAIDKAKSFATKTILMQERHRIMSAPQVAQQVDVPDLMNQIKDMFLQSMESK